MVEAGGSNWLDSKSVSLPEIAVNDNDAADAGSIIVGSRAEGNGND